MCAERPKYNANVAMTERYRLRRAAGLCGACGLVQTASSRCEACAEKLKRRQRRAGDLDRMDAKLAALPRCARCHLLGHTERECDLHPESRLMYGAKGYVWPDGGSR